MALPTLKSLLGKRSETAAWLQTYAEQFQAKVWVEDAGQYVVFGTSGIVNEPNMVPVLVDDTIVGYVKGDAHSNAIARLLAILLQKEAEKKKLGTEVLQLYQELNVIYNFSEKLTDTIDPDIIAQITLEQAMHSIPSDSGVIVLWDENSRQLNIPASSGEPLFDFDNVKGNSAVLIRIGLSGQSEIMSDLLMLKEKSIIKEEVQSLIYAAIKVKQRIMGAIILASHTNDQYKAAHLKLLVTLALQSATAIESALLYEKNIREVREREEAILRIHEITKKFVPNEFILSLGKDAITDVRLGDLVEKNVTVLFTDIRDFTSLSEQMTPEQNFRFVSSFNERLGPVIREHHGFINQYLGDSIMAIFPGHPKDALDAAIGMHRAIHTLNEERAAAGLPLIKAGIGMHTGPLIMGITGDEHRLDAATISDTVNTASRIESLTKFYKSPLLLSSETLLHIPASENYIFRQLGRVLLKGKNNYLTIVECLNGNADEIHQIKLVTFQKFKEAMEHYQQRNFERSLQLFGAVLEIDPEDFTASVFREKAMKYLHEGIPENWNGVEEMLSK